MTTATIWIPKIIFISLGIFSAKRWIVVPSPLIAKFPRNLRFCVFLVVCWIGTFVVSAVANRIGFLLSDGVAYDEGVEVPYDVIHDGVGDNVVNLFLGWSSGLVFWGIAHLAWKQPTDGESDS